MNIYKVIILKHENTLFAVYWRKVRHPDWKDLDLSKDSVCMA